MTKKIKNTEKTIPVLFPSCILLKVWAVCNILYHKYPPYRVVGSRLIQKAPTLFGVWKWGFGVSPAAPIVSPTLGRRHQHVAQCYADI